MNNSVGEGMATRVKTAEEIELIARASRIVSETLAMLRQEVRPGVTTRTLDRLAEDFIRAARGEPAFKGYVVQGQAFPSTLCTSVNDAVVHGIPDDRELRDGDVLSLDCGVLRDGYYGDSAATYAVGEVGELEEKLIRVTRESLELGAAEAVVGNRIYDISRAVQRHVESNGFSVVRELVGHGIGRSLHEEPAIPNFVPSPFQRHHFKNTQLVDGMTICVEPMVNAGTFRVVTRQDMWTVATADGRPSAHFEHTLVVREGKPEILTSHVF